MDSFQLEMAKKYGVAITNEPIPCRKCGTMHTDPGHICSNCMNKVKEAPKEPPKSPENPASEDEIEPSRIEDFGHTLVLIDGKAYDLEERKSPGCNHEITRAWDKAFGKAMGKANFCLSCGIKMRRRQDIRK